VAVRATGWEQAKLSCDLLIVRSSGFAVNDLPDLQPIQARLDQRLEDSRGEERLLAPESGGVGQRSEAAGLVD
jgi:hypothetical protein